MVFPGDAKPCGAVFGGDALKLIGKAHFVTATRQVREVMVMAVTNHINFNAPIDGGDRIELVSRMNMVGRGSLSVEMLLWAERLLSGKRRCSATTDFFMMVVESSR